MNHKRKLKIDGFKAATLLYGPPKTKTTQQRLELERKDPQQVEAEKADEQAEKFNDLYL